PAGEGRTGRGRRGERDGGRSEEARAAGRTAVEARGRGGHGAGAGAGPAHGERVRGGVARVIAGARGQGVELGRSGGVHPGPGTAAEEGRLALQVERIR